MTVPPEVQQRLIDLKVHSKSEREFKQFVWMNGLQEYLIIDNNDFDRARREFRKRKGHHPLAANSAFDLVVECLDEFGLINKGK